MTAVQESSTREVVAVVKSMGLPGGLGSVNTITEWLDEDTITLPCLRRADKGSQCGCEGLSCYHI